ncbi:MAG: hypothetical protein KGN02_11980 [bacterium]|nr:hypothetical protein [bacterium]
MNDRTDYTANEFEAESRYLETLIWESLVVERDMRLLVCGYGPEGSLVKRAIESGARTTVIEHRNEEIVRFAPLGAKLLRGSTSVIPAKENSFDLAIAYHYLHEIDPFFHAQVLSELARVATRVAVVEPAPPADPLGKRIALLYSQAKRELGAFEYYQPLEYWKKLLQAVKAEVSQHVFAFSKTPPREYLRDTVKLLIDTIELEEAPREYVEELRAIAQRSDAALLPPPRYVLVGAAVGELIVPSFSRRPEQRVSAKPSRVPTTASELAKKIEVAREVSQAAGYEFPPVEPARALTPPETITAAPAPASPPPATPAPTAPAFTPPPAPAVPGFGPSENVPAPGFGVPGLPFGTPTPAVPAAETPPVIPPPFGSPFAVPEPLSDGGGFGLPGEPPPTSPWAWEPPEGPSEPQP